MRSDLMSLVDHSADSGLVVRDVPDIVPIDEKGSLESNCSELVEYRVCVHERAIIETQRDCPFLSAAVNGDAR
jgi:hypothetical protein